MDIANCHIEQQCLFQLADNTQAISWHDVTERYWGLSEHRDTPSLGRPARPHTSCQESQRQRNDHGGRAYGGPATFRTASMTKMFTGLPSPSCDGPAFVI
jgi:hypothetical protein